MDDSDREISAPLEPSQGPSLLADIVSDNYLLLLAVALLVLFVSLAVLVGFSIGHYGLGFGPAVG